ncbi:MAG: glycosyltransferase family 2 protein [Acetobacteraceae bacterium]|nr:glycosyltransferase family 2 protein [Acetobacteraceae bacterium]
MRIAIGIATRGRAGVLCETLREVHRQLRQPDRLLICHTVPEDIAGAAAVAPEAEFIASPPGLPRQRNAILDAAAEDGCDAVLFLDDDFLPAPEYLAVTDAVLRERPDCVVTTGTVLADGAKGPGITPEQGRVILAHDRFDGPALGVTPHFNGYGCNMAVRLDPALAHGLRFDEALPLYAWYEDIDFTRALGRHGAILRLAGARGVHLGVKSARTPGLRLGYSQVVNPVYLARKGTFPWSHAIPSAARHIAMNLARSAFPEPEVDRWGRFRGNMIGVFDLLRGRAAPGRILSL